MLYAGRSCTYNEYGYLQDGFIYRPTCRTYFVTQTKRSTRIKVFEV